MVFGMAGVVLPLTFAEPMRPRLMLLKKCAFALLGVEASFSCCGCDPMLIGAAAAAFDGEAGATDVMNESLSFCSRRSKRERVCDIMDEDDVDDGMLDDDDETAVMVALVLVEVDCWPAGVVGVRALVGGSPEAVD